MKMEDEEIKMLVILGKAARKLAEKDDIEERRIGSIGIDTTIQDTELAKDEAAVCVGMQIRMARQNAGITMAKLGELTGFSQPHLSKIEQGKMNITIETVACISAALKTRILI